MSIYQKYFAPHKVAQHYAQHFLFGCIAFLILSYSINQFRWQYFWIFLLFTYLIDLDGLLAVIIQKKYHPFLNQVKSLFNQTQCLSAAEKFAVEHNTINTLILHNVLGLFVFMVFFPWIIAPAKANMATRKIPFLRLIIRAPTAGPTQFAASFAPIFQPR